MPAADVADRCRVLGILNVTPDSFSDGGRFNSIDAAVARGLELVRHGADFVDVGGESTRPGARRVSEPEERRRVLPVVAALSEAGVRVSVDTMRASIAAAAVAAGAVLVNDVSGGLADPAMLPFLAESDVQCVLMHWRGHAEIMQDLAIYRSVVEDVCIELAQRSDAALAAGVRPENIVLDPGLGFAKNSGQSWSLLAALPRLHMLGFPVLVGASRKRFLAECVDYGGLDPSISTDRDDVSNAVSALAASAGAWGVRVHSVGPAAAAVRTASRLRAAALGED
ncbi:dihydropteroate synthase [Micromonospora sp. KC606]|nr:dihydropteroate synthase [Micromonospora sp. KC606]